MESKATSPESPFRAFTNEDGRIQCGRQEFRSGDCVDVFIKGVWIPTRIEHNGKEYYSIDFLPLIDNPIRFSDG